MTIAKLAFEKNAFEKIAIEKLAIRETSNPATSNSATKAVTKSLQRTDTSSVELSWLRLRRRSVTPR